MAVVPFDGIYLTFTENVFGFLFYNFNPSWIVVFVLS